MTASSPPLVTAERRGDVVVITIDHPPVNALNASVRAALLAAFDEIMSDQSITAVVLSAVGPQFIAGSDLSEFDGPIPTPLLPAVLDAMDACRVPIVAALRGAALGGGFETVLTCDARIGSSSTVVGLPEVTLGILPGAGGTQRLPRLVGRRAALDMITSGRRVQADEAFGLGILDVLVEDESSLIDTALAYASTMTTRRRLRDASVPFGQDPTGEEAPLATSAKDNIVRATELVLAAGTEEFDVTLRRERVAFDELRESFTAKALRYVFFAERSVTDELRGGDAKTIHQAGVVGAGTMGFGIATVLAESGIPVVVIDTDASAISRAMASLEIQLADRVSRGRMTQSSAEKVRGLITMSQSFDALASTDIVVEAVFEDLGLKQEVLGRIVSATKPGTVVATNTSYLSVELLAASSGRPADAIGMHFFHPARVMRLVEVIPASTTSSATVSTVAELARKVRKVAVRSGPDEGFIGNRIYSAYRNQCEQLLIEGATPSQVDAAMVGFGFAMGLFSVSDSSGLDIAWARRKQLRAAGVLSAEPTVADRLCEQGRFGVKTGAGWYSYRAGSRVGEADPEVEQLIRAESSHRGIERRSFTPVEIQEANMAAIVAEAANVVRRGTATNGRAIDVVLLNGFGFPKSNGGPVFWARHQPREHLLNVIRRTAQGSGLDLDLVALTALLDEEPA